MDVKLGNGHQCRHSYCKVRHRDGSTSVAAIIFKCKGFENVQGEPKKCAMKKHNSWNYFQTILFEKYTLFGLNPISSSSNAIYFINFLRYGPFTDMSVNSVRLLCFTFKIPAITEILKGGIRGTRRCGHNIWCLTR